MKRRGGYEQMRGGTWGKGVRSHPRAYYIRFTEEEAEPLSKMLRRRRLTMQAFGHAAIIRACNEAELGKKTAVEAIEEAQLERKKEGEATPKGLGIREQLQESRDRENEREERLARDRERERDRSHTSVNTPSLVASSIDGEILALARTVVESPKSARAEVLRAACRALAKGRSLEEATRLADDLDAAIKRLDGVPQTALERVRSRMGR